LAFIQRVAAPTGSVGNVSQIRTAYSVLYKTAVRIVIVGNLDNVVRPFLIARGGSDTPLVLVILGVLGGAMAFGLIGLFLGPALLAVGYSMFDEWSSDSQQLVSHEERKAT
jgi:predicted PurR-regulated permease PerM